MGYMIVFITVVRIARRDGHHHHVTIAHLVFQHLLAIFTCVDFTFI